MIIRCKIFNLGARAELSGVVLVTDPVPLKSPDTDLGSQQLVWEVTPHQLREFRSRKILLRVELHHDKVVILASSMLHLIMIYLQELVGHLVLDLRTAQPIKNGDNRPDVKTHKIVGTTISLQVSLALEEAENVDVDITEEDSDTEVQTVTHVDKEAEGEIIPTLIEDSSDGEGGYFLVGPRSSASGKFSLSLCLVSAHNLSLTVEPSTVYQDKYYWQYNLLGVDISTEQFSSLNIEEGDAGSFVSERATATIKTSRETLAKFLARSSVTIKLCNGAVVIAAADLPLSCLLDPTDLSLDQGVTVGRQVELVSGHNLAVVHDSDGNKPLLGVRLTLTSREDEAEITSGNLSDSDDMEVEEVTDGGETKLSTTEPPRPYSPPTKISKPDPSEPEGSVISTPKKPRLSPQVFTPVKTPKSILPQDTTEYLSIKTPTMSESTDKPRHFKLSVDLVSVKITKENLDGQDGVLAYKYQALHKEAIRTDKFTIRRGQNLPVPKGYCQFSFCVLKDKMISTFQQHLVHIALYANSQLLGLSSLNLLDVVKKNIWNGSLNIADKQSGDLIGQIEVELQLLEDVDSPKKVIEKKHEELMANKDLLNQAAKELEVWKTDQKKKFNENLLEIEQNHLNMLGQEWKEREVEREQEMQTKLSVMKNLEEELRQELEKIEAERKEMDETRRALKSDQDKVESEKRSVKTERLAVVDRLKQQIRDKDQQIAVKDSELDLLSKKVKTLEADSRRTRFTKSGSNERSRKDEEIMAELNQVCFFLIIDITSNIQTPYILIAEI